MLQPCQVAYTQDANIVCSLSLYLVQPLQYPYMQDTILTNIMHKGRGVLTPQDPGLSKPETVRRAGGGPPPRARRALKDSDEGFDTPTTTAIFCKTRKNLWGAIFLKKHILSHHRFIRLIQNIREFESS